MHRLVASEDGGFPGILGLVHITFTALGSGHPQRETGPDSPYPSTSFLIPSFARQHVLPGTTSFGCFQTSDTDVCYIDIHTEEAPPRLEHVYTFLSRRFRSFSVIGLENHLESDIGHSDPASSVPYQFMTRVLRGLSACNYAGRVSLSNVSLPALPRDALQRLCSNGARFEVVHPPLANGTDVGEALGPVAASLYSFGCCRPVADVVRALQPSLAHLETLVLPDVCMFSAEPHLFSQLRSLQRLAILSGSPDKEWRATAASPLPHILSTLKDLGSAPVLTELFLCADKVTSQHPTLIEEIILQGIVFPHVRFLALPVDLDLVRLAPMFPAVSNLRSIVQGPYSIKPHMYRGWGKLCCFFFKPLYALL